VKRTNKSLWHDIVDSLGDAVIALDLDLSPLAANAAAATILGVSQVNRRLIENLGRQNGWFQRMLQVCLETGQDLADPEATLYIGPRAVLVRAEVAPLQSANGGSAGIIVLLHDLSHQKSAEHALEKGEPILRLSPAGLAHEVKNPLTGIKGAAELLAAMFPGEPRAREYCDLILSGVNRIAALVEQVLAVSGPQRLRREPVNIHRTLHQALRMAGLEINRRETSGIVVEQEFDPSLPEVIGDEAALERVFLNLIRNAVEAMEERGTVRLRTRMETEFRLSAEGKRIRFLRVDVADSGPGMTEGEMRQLFTPFFTTKASGSGLGLVLSQRIVFLHGGKLWAERGGISPAEAESEGRAAGMTFKVTLPVNM
jgi:two-component system nitrogen regulation sensor histidine kinase GlnL